MSFATETPSEGQLLSELRTFVVGQLNVCTPARVVNYNPEAGTATVQPDIGLRIRVPDSDTFRTIQAPQVEEVPVLWPVWGGSQFGIVGRLAPGDRVTLVMSDKSLDEWKLSAQAPIRRLDPRRCQLTDAMAIVGGYPEGPPDSADGALVVVGPDIRLGSAGASDPVVTESRLKALLSQYELAFNTHTHLSAAPSNPTTTPAGTWPGAGEIASKTVKVP